MLLKCLSDLAKFGFAHWTVWVQNFLFYPDLYAVLVEDMVALCALHERPRIRSLASVFV